MPAIRSTGRNRKPPPAGFEDIEDTLLEFSNKMKDAQSAPHEGKKKHETLWPIMQISHQRKLDNPNKNPLLSSPLFLSLFLSLNCPNPQTELLYSHLLCC